MHKLAVLIQLAALAISVNAHTIFQQMYVNGADQGHLTGIRVPDYDGPIQDVSSNDIICNGGINPYHNPLSKTVITVPAGAQVTAEWHHTLNGRDPGDAADPIDPSHKGPVITYLAKVSDATSMTVTGLKWFKIQEEGYDPSTRQWGVDKLIANQGKYTFTIPSCIAAGDYLLRHELIALHGASNYPGAQFYMECAQIRVTGGGSTNPATVSFPGAYSGSDPGIKVNIYSALSSYKIPGPPVFSCSGSLNPSNPPPATSNPPPATSTLPPASTPNPPASTPPATGGAAQYAQCGGDGFSGPTSCVSPFACTKLNDYYSQCL